MIRTFLEDRRVTEFECNGRKAQTVSGLSIPVWAKEKLSEILKSIPEITCRKLVKLEKDGQTISVLINKYIDARVEDIIIHQASVHPERIALKDRFTDRSYTYKELNSVTNRLARGFYKAGVRPHDMVSVIIPTSGSNYISKFAINKLGAVIVNVNFMERGSAAMGYVLRSNSSTLIMRPSSKRTSPTELIDVIFEMCPELADPSQDPNNLRLNAFPDLRRIILCDTELKFPGTININDIMDIDDSPIYEVENTKKDEDVSTIIHTSGTTSIPKGAMLTHRSIMEVMCMQANMINLDEEDSTFISLPLFHAFGSIGASLPTFTVGGKVICYDRPSVEDICRILIDEKCTVFCNVPSIYQQLLQMIHAQEIPKESFNLKKCVAAGAASTEAMLRDVSETFGVNNVIATYGMTETTTGITGSLHTDTLEQRTATVGAPWPGVEVKFLDKDTGKELPYGEAGEICVRGFNVMKGYYNMPEETAHALDNDGWLRTGDMGLMRPDNHIQFICRLKESIKKHGETISPLEIENVIQQDERFLKSAVVGVPDPISGEELAVFIILPEGITATEQDVVNQCAKQLSRFKIPKYIWFVDEFPTSATGKIQKNKLKEIAAERVK